MAEGPIKWTSSLLIGDELIDIQHRTFFQKALRVQVAIKLGRGDEEIATAIEFMSEYARIHFADEIERMAACHYPYIQTHREEHDAFIAQLDKLKDEFVKATDRVEVAKRTVHLATSWFIKHIRSTDQPLADFLARSNPDRLNKAASAE